MKRKKNYICLIGMAGLAISMLGCKSETKAEKIELLAPVETVVDVETVMYRDLYEVTTQNAELAPYTTELSFQAGGRISRMYVKAGTVVKAGDLLAEQEEDGVRDAASAALNKYLSEKKSYVDRIKKANKKLKTGLNQEETKRQEMEIEQAEELWAMQEPVLWETWETARDRMGNSKIYAPYDGVVTACVSEGATVAAGQSVLALADTERLYITANTYMDPSEYASYERVYGIVNGKETELKYEEELMSEESVYTFFSAEDYNEAKMGDFVLLCMISKYHPQVLSLPDTAIYRDSNGTYVYLMENGTRTRRDVVTGYKGTVYTEIADGLKEGDQIYVKD